MQRCSLRTFVMVIPCLTLIFAALILRPLLHVSAASASITLSQLSGPPATSITVSGNGFVAGGMVKLDFDTTRVGTARTSSTGTFSKKITIPTSTLPGSYIVQVVEQGNDISARASFLIHRPSTDAKGSGDWPTYMGSNARTGFNAAETVITPATAPHLKQRWTHQAAGVVATQPITANGNVYWGSGDGFEHATNTTTGKDVWTANLGTSTNTCTHVVHGVLSSAAVATVTIAGAATSVVFVGGGNVQLYALNALTGAVIWHTPLGTQPNYFLYGSPAVYHGSVYIGLSSHGDCPLIQGALLQLNASTGAIQHSFAVVPSGCIGGSIWVAPAIDTATNMLYVATGNEGTCSTTETMTDALIELRTKDLSLVASWQVPVAEQILDGDFGSTPMLFHATISGTVRHMVGLVNKNGIYYALDRTNISAGPLWEERMAAAPINGSEDNIASSAWDQTTLYEAGGSATINGATCAGHLRAVNPANGAFLWQDCLASDVFGPVTAVPGLLEVGSGSSLLLIDATTGQQLFAFQDTTTKSFFQGPGTISNGVLYHGNKDGLLYAFGT